MEQDFGEHPSFLYTPTQRMDPSSQTPNTTTAGQRLYGMAVEACMSSPSAAGQLSTQDLATTSTLPPVKAYASTGMQTSPGMTTRTGVQTSTVMTARTGMHALPPRTATTGVQRATVMTASTGVQTSPALSTSTGVQTAALMAIPFPNFKPETRIIRCDCCSNPLICSSGHIFGADLDAETIAIIENVLTDAAFKKLGRRLNKRARDDIESDVSADEDRTSPSRKRRFVGPPGSTPFRARSPRKTTTYEERRRRRIMEGKGLINPPTLFRLPELIAHNEENREVREEVREEMPAMNFPPNEAATSNSQSGISSPSRFRDLFGIVPRSISKLFSNPFCEYPSFGLNSTLSGRSAIDHFPVTLRPEPEPENSYSVPVEKGPSEISTKAFNTSGQVDSTADLDISSGLLPDRSYRHRYLSQPERPILTLEQRPESLTPASSLERTTPQDLALKASPSKAASPKSTSPAASKPSNKRKRPIPNPPGCSYGMDLNYFCIYSDSDEESSTSSTGNAPYKDPKQPTVIPTSRPMKRVRFDASPEDTPSKLRLHAATDASGQQFMGTPNSRPRATDPYTGQHFYDPADRFARPTNLFSGSNSFGTAGSEDRTPRPISPYSGSAFLGMPSNPYTGAHFMGTADQATRTTDPNSGEHFAGAADPFAHQTASTAPIPTASNLTDVGDTQPYNVTGLQPPILTDAQNPTSTDVQPVDLTNVAPPNLANLQPSAVDDPSLDETISNNKSAATKSDQELIQEMPAPPATETTMQPAALAKLRSEAEKYKPKTPSALRESRRYSSPLIGSPAQRTVFEGNDEFSNDAKWLLERCPSGNLSDLQWPQANTYADLTDGDARPAQIMSQAWSDDDASSGYAPFCQSLEGFGTTFA
jgi:hypothetical protein